MTPRILAILIDCSIPLLGAMYCIHQGYLVKSSEEEDILLSDRIKRNRRIFRVLGPLMIATTIISALKGIYRVPK